ncbi:helix-turn-helix transcriptional regulator [Rhodoferax sp. OV413]|uniref:helix-turn-helix domain-containing protein n=1 Tax=Rhodoferax sp. OV413 TaxID=1855285 RepID=UPI000B825E2B|nr:helix-turn-helix transcriptional regulator [Rhodoferax sp. OV413]
MPSRLKNSPPARGRPPGARSFDANVASAFGSIVREDRLAAGISQETLAHFADVERSYLGRIERGESQPTLFVVLKICSALGSDSGSVVSRVEDFMRRGNRSALSKSK